MPKVLIITYYWPPAGSSGVQRWLKFVKYLREFGWEPVIYTAKDPEVSSLDESLVRDIPVGLEVIRRHVPEPYSFYRMLTGRKTQRIGVGFTSATAQRKSMASNLAMWIRGNLFIPDARMLWIRPSTRFLKKYLKENPVDAIVSTGPPHSLHLIALRLKRKLSLPWVADFRDPWTNIDYYRELPLTKLADRVHHKLEGRVLATADCCVCVSATMANEFEQLGARRVEVITNGYDNDDYEIDGIRLDPQFTITHTGSIPPSRNCNNLWKAIARLAREDSEFNSALRLKFAGNLDHSLIESINKAGLGNHTEFLGYQPHGVVNRIQQSAQVLLLLINNAPNARGILTGKVFEYLAAKRPIMAIGPSGGDTDALLAQTGAGILLPFESENIIYEGLQKLWHEYKNGWSNFKPGCTAGYSRRELTRKLSIILDRINAK